MTEIKTAVCVLFNNKKEVLLQKKTLDYPHWPGYWCLFGGVIEENETPEETIRREIKEELGIEIKELEFLKVQKYKTPGSNLDVEEHEFFAFWDGNLKDIRISEGAGFCLFDMSEIDSIKINSANLEAIKISHSKLKSI